MILQAAACDQKQNSESGFNNYTAKNKNPHRMRFLGFDYIS